jgi:hypothetical protein
MNLKKEKNVAEAAGPAGAVRRAVNRQPLNSDSFGQRRRSVKKLVAS